MTTKLNVLQVIPKLGKGGAFAQVEMKSVNKNTKLNERFRSSETVEKASVEETSFNYLYEDENNYFFMNPKSFEQIEIKKNIVGDNFSQGVTKRLGIDHQSLKEVNPKILCGTT